ncbi:LOC105158161 [Blepharisma stoltei]|uniref:Palmitoyltransferase n=1 Tax=Blepharisma stoltei TaxID=1481888 RepID=A0AAU9IDU4_9CILI|nr:unnamed protein product [Blepharisma stoltei]
MTDKEKKAFTQWPGTNKFYCSGRIMMGPDNHRAFITFFLILCPEIVYIASPSVYFIKEHDNPGPFLVNLFFTILSLFFLYRCATKNPGFIPKQKPPFAWGPSGALTIQELMEDSFKPKEVPCEGNLVRLKYCVTCNIIRPPRASHCSDCGVCVEKFDHHCPWLGNCVAKRNYREFIAFLISTSMLDISTMGFCIYHIADVWTGEGSGTSAFASAMQQTGPSVALLLYGFLAFWFVVGLTMFHMYLLFTGQSTHEKIKGNFKIMGENPYHRGNYINNCMKVIYGPTPPQHFNLRAPAAKREDHIELSHSKLAMVAGANNNEEKAAGTISPSEIHIVRENSPDGHDSR